MVVKSRSMKTHSCPSIHGTQEFIASLREITERPLHSVRVRLPPPAPSARLLDIRDIVRNLESPIRLSDSKQSSHRIRSTAPYIQQSNETEQSTQIIRSHSIRLHLTRPPLVSLTRHDTTHVRSSVYCVCLSGRLSIAYRSTQHAARHTSCPSAPSRPSNKHAHVTSANATKPCPPLT